MGLLRPHAHRKTRCAVEYQGCGPASLETALPVGAKPPIFARVKQANELVAFIRSRGVLLTQRGKQLVGFCPFHDDHEPSLVVDARKQLWNCLGACREGGDVYRFVMKADGVYFREAHRRLGGHDSRHAQQFNRGLSF